MKPIQKQTTEPDHQERVQKTLARAGLGSRRQIEQRIKQGEVKIDGEKANLGQAVGHGQTIELDQLKYRVTANQSQVHKVVMYNKPEGVICTRSDPEGRPTVFDKIPAPRSGRWVTVGRLDINTSGLLLLTTDGELANALMHPSNGVDREYACRINGEVSDETLEKLKAGVELEDGKARFSDIVRSGGDGENHWFHVVLMEGKNREVRRLWASQDVRVSRLKRVRYGPVFIPSRLKVGRWEELNDKDIKVLRQDVGLKAYPPAELGLKKLSGKTRPRRQR